MAREVQVTIDAADPEAAPGIFLQRVPEAKSAKNRVHLDVRAAPGLEGDEADGRAGGRGRPPGRPRRHPPGAARARSPLSAGFVVLADPEGNELCLD